MGAKNKSVELILVEKIEPLILMFRDQKVLLDNDLAVLYGVPTKALNQAVKRNLQRFPDDFMFQLTAEETETMRSRNVTASDTPPSVRSHSVTASKRNVRYLPYAFTEHGAMMEATILNSPRAIEVSVFVVRAFVKMRQLVLTHKDLAVKLEQLERKVAGHDDSIRSLVAAIRQLMQPTDSKPKRQIGFHTRVK